MTHRLNAVAWVALVAAGLCACNNHRSAPTDGPPPTGTATPSPTGVATPPSHPPGSPIRCQSDADCHALPCGPCDPGKVITTDMIDERRECYVNPCLHAAAYCNPDHLCAIHPKTEKDPRVWGIDAGAPPGCECGCNPNDLACQVRCEHRKH